MTHQTPGYADTLTPDEQTAELSRIVGEPVVLPVVVESAKLPDALTASEAAAAAAIVAADPVNAERAAAKERQERVSAEIDDWYYKRGRA